MNTTKRAAAYFAFLVILAYGIGSASAQIVTVNFSGAVTYISGEPFGLSLSLGEPVGGSFTYDTSLSPAYNVEFGGGAVAGYIQPPPSGISVTISGVTLQSDNYNSYQVQDNVFGVDNINGFFTPISVAGVLQENFSSVSFILNDFSQTALSSTALPLFLNAESFEQRIGHAYDDTSQGSFDFSIVWFAGTPVPEPGSLLLLLGSIINNG